MKELIDELNRWHDSVKGNLSLSIKPDEYVLYYDTIPDEITIARGSDLEEVLQSGIEQFKAAAEDGNE